MGVAGQGGRLPAAVQLVPVTKRSEDTMGPSTLLPPRQRPLTCGRQGRGRPRMQQPQAGSDSWCCSPRLPDPLRPRKLHLGGTQAGRCPSPLQVMQPPLPFLLLRAAATCPLQATARRALPL